MHADVVPDPHRHARPGIDAIQARLSSAPDSDARRELLVDRTREREPTVHEPVAAAQTHHSALHIAVEQEVQRHRSTVHARLEEHSEGVPAAAEAADVLATFGGDPQRYP